MEIFHNLTQVLGSNSVPALMVVGIMILAGFYFGKTMKFIKLPSIIGYMLIGVILGGSILNLISPDRQISLSFITEMALGFVALSIGLELKFSTLKSQGLAIILIILFESFLAFGVVTAGIYLLTKNLPLALIFGSIAPASAPAGTVAVIKEYKAKGPLTSALYSVVGFDDGLCIIIFGFSSAIAKNLLLTSAGAEAQSFIHLIGEPLMEIGLSLIVGVIAGFLFSKLVGKLKHSRDILILMIATVLFITGLSTLMNLSLILTNMVLGIFIVNSQSSRINSVIRDELEGIMPLLFIMFFVLAGANLHLASLPALGLLGLVYLATRSAGLMSGATLGAVVGRAPSNLKKYLGMGILSQAGVAIGLSLIVKQTFTPISAEGAFIGTTVITTITATSIIFEIFGPILARYGLSKAGEIKSKKAVAETK